MVQRRLSVIEYGVGNIRSVVDACNRAGAETFVARSGEELRSQAPERIVLPGVGAVGAALANLRERGFGPILDEAVQKRGVPFLGICVGMQVMGTTCLEFGEHRGFGWIPGTVDRLATKESPVRLPHVGWNTLHVTGSDDPVFAGLDREDAYFVHSFAMQCAPEFVAATTEYHGTFISAVRRGHVRGVQFHPEKSAMLGARLLGAFLD